jgi:hypothetical protein
MRLTGLGGEGVYRNVKLSWYNKTKYTKTVYDKIIARLLDQRHMPSITIKPDPFYDREAELAALDRAWRRHGGGQMLMLYGRRRLGKTYLLQRYFAGGVSGNEAPRPHCYFLAEQTTAAAQRAMLAQELLGALPGDGVAPEELAISWNALLRHVSQHAQSRNPEAGRFALILDEFPYLVEQTPELPSILQAWWDRDAAHAPLFVILCGSQLSAMAALGSESAPLFGRFNAGIFQLEPLSYREPPLWDCRHTAYVWRLWRHAALPCPGRHVEVGP